mgnify:CR=1 FL=1
MFKNVHHIAIIGTDYIKTREFYVDKLGFEVISEHNRPEKNDIIINVKQGDLVLEIFIKEDAPLRPKMPSPEHSGLRHLAFKVDDVEVPTKLAFSLKKQYGDSVINLLLVRIDKNWFELWLEKIGG